MKDSDQTLICDYKILSIKIKAFRTYLKKAKDIMDKCWILSRNEILKYLTDIAGHKWILRTSGQKRKAV